MQASPETLSLHLWDLLTHFEMQVRCVTKMQSALQRLAPAGDPRREVTLRQLAADMGDLVRINQVLSAVAPEALDTINTMQNSSFEPSA